MMGTAVLTFAFYQIFLARLAESEASSRKLRVRLHAFGVGVREFSGEIRSGVSSG